MMSGLSSTQRITPHAAVTRTRTARKEYTTPALLASPKLADNAIFT